MSDPYSQTCQIHVSNLDITLSSESSKHESKIIFKNNKTILKY